MALKLFAQNKGFSLLEVLIGVAVLSGGITVILQAFIFCGRTTGASCDTVRGIFLAEDKMQELEFKTNNQIITEPVSQAGQYDGFRWEYRLFEEEDKAGLYKMDLEVRWGKPVREQNLELTSWLLKR